MVFENTSHLGNTRHVKPSEAPTIRAKRSPVVLVIGCGEEFVRRCAVAAAQREATVVAVAAGEESEFVAHTLPVAVVMPVSAARTSTLATIARDLRITLATVEDETMSDEAVTALITGAIARKRGGTGG